MLGKLRPATSRMRVSSSSEVEDFGSRSTFTPSFRATNRVVARNLRRGNCRSRPRPACCRAVPRVEPIRGRGASAAALGRGRPPGLPRSCAAEVTDPAYRTPLGRPRRVRAGTPRISPRPRSVPRGKTPSRTKITRVVVIGPVWLAAPTKPGDSRFLCCSARTFPADRPGWASTNTENPPILRRRCA